MIGHGHGKYQIDGLAIGSAEFNRRLKAQQYAAGLFKAGTTAMRDGNAVANAGAAQAFARLQAVAQFFCACLLSGQPLRGCLQYRIPVHRLYHVGAQFR